MRESVDLDTRIQNKTKVSENGCIVWTGAMHNTNVSPTIAKHSYGGEQVNVRKYLYGKEFNKALKKLDKLSFSCNNARCVNPKHAIVKEFVYKSTLKSTGSMCGTPSDFYVKGVCMSCRKLNARHCISCNVEFMPGCKVRFMCFDCYIHGENRDNEGFTKTNW